MYKKNDQKNNESVLKCYKDTFIDLSNNLNSALYVTLVRYRREYQRIHTNADFSFDKVNTNFNHFHQ